MDCIILDAFDQFTMSCPETSKARRHELLTFRNGSFVANSGMLKFGPRVC
jgi:hypothetical protein